MNVSELKQRSLLANKNPNLETLLSVSNEVLAPYKQSGAVGCINLDSFKFTFYPNSTKGNVPCSADALIFESNGTYLIEFKSNTCDTGELVRKIYDSVMLFVEHGGYDFSRARREIIFILVAKKVISCAEKAISRCKSFMSKPWIQFKAQLDHWGLANLEGVVVKTTYVMSPEIFDQFVRHYKWK